MFYQEDDFALPEELWETWEEEKEYIEFPHKNSDFRRDPVRMKMRDHRHRDPFPPLDFGNFERRVENRRFRRRTKLALTGLVPSEHELTRPNDAYTPFRRTCGM